MKIQFRLMRWKIRSYRKAGAKIGNNVRLWGRIDAINPHMITIGNNVCIGAESYLISHDPIRPGKVFIEDNVWIGFRCIILPDVVIGRGSLIGAGSVVTKDIPPNSIACGNPARVIGERNREEMLRTIYLIQNDLPVGKVEK